VARSGNVFVTYGQEQALLPTKGRQIWTSLLVLFLLLLPFLAEPYWLDVSNRALLTVIGAVGLAVLTGLSGQISLAHGAFIAVGGYVSGVAVTHWDVGFIVALASAVLIAMTLAVITALPTLRLDRLYLAIATMAFQFALLFAVTRFDYTGGNTGFYLAPATVFGVELVGPKPFYPIIAVLAVLTVLFAVNIRRGRSGRAFGAIRDRDIAAQAVGVNLVHYRLIAYAFSAACAAVVGVISAYYQGSVSPDGFPFDLSIQYISMVIVGGLGRISGAVMGALLLALVPEGLRLVTSEFQTVMPTLASNLLLLQSGIYGLILALVLLVQPEGLYGIWIRVKRWWLTYPYAYRS